MDKQKARFDIIQAALPIVAFDGWNSRVLQQAAAAAGYKKTDAIRVFPGGAIDAVDAFLSISDTAMEQGLQHYNLETMKVRERINLAVRTRIEVHVPHREAVRKTIAFLGLPLYGWLGIKALYRTVDNIWYVAGDQSTDFNFYTKRLSLAAVYSSTLLYWLEDKSPAYEQTWQFLDRRINDVMALGKLKRQAQQGIENLYRKFG